MLEVLVRAVIAVAAVILFTRLNGLRSFSKMSSFDFAMTVALGSILATTIVDRSLDLRIGLASLAAIYVVQAALSMLRVWVRPVRRAVDNTPLLLLRDGEILRESLREGRVTEEDLLARLRMADATHLDEVAAVVLETTGDMSVIRDPEGRGVEKRLLAGVRGA
ncbi:DUF421 domain-containing protein [Tropicimonas isoalkanivorans]|uniref:Uncharacterized membrane protein YcaP, DUF421 family n=1 Tax=Tropicimonas isoalkanivorans TaxID=441112 RepID=A0A1I1E827_9RHOB|nr:YetF domain-containing protein [Tropicimonas isoalkanivorans]SFB82792.1 Uncharacterized membrane protein YcaP, DUF421 family [Tropicimonas isoalkanivorans]